MPITKLLISKGLFFTRFAVVTDGLLCNLSIEREGFSSLVDGIYLGRVTKVLPAINAAFVNCGLNRPAFLRLDEGGHTLEDKARRISVLDHVTEGAKVLVQVKTDEKEGKGARVSRRLSLAGRYFVLNPFGQGVNVSRRILVANERQRLAKVAAQQCQVDEGFTVRTAAENQSDNVLSLDILELQERWSRIQRIYKCTEKTGLIRPAANGIQKFLTEQINSKIDSVVVDHRDVFFEVKTFCERNNPEILTKIKLHDSSQEIFGDPMLEEQFEDTFRSEVGLPSGGRIYFDETRSMTTIDVDTSGASDGGNRFSRILQTNLEAATVLSRQLRLRNVGGLVAIDFIGMRLEKDKAKVINALKDGFSNDPSFVRISDFSEFGVVELTRERKGLSNVNLFMDPCTHCTGGGRQKAMMSIVEDMFSTLVKNLSVSAGKKCSVVSNVEISNFINKNCLNHISNLEDKWAVSISFASDPNLERGEYRVFDGER